MSAQHTQDTLIVLPPSVGVDANWHVTDKGDTFVAHVFGFGHAVDKQSEINARRIAACWNACEGITDDELSHGPVLPLHRHSELINQRDELLEVLKHIRRCIPYGGFVQIHDNSMTLAQIDAAIAKAEGSAA